MPRSHVPPSLVIDDSGILPEVGPMTAGIIVREDFDAEELRPMIAALRAIFSSREKIFLSMALGPSSRSILWGHSTPAALPSSN